MKPDLVPCSSKNCGRMVDRMPQGRVVVCICGQATKGEGVDGGVAESQAGQPQPQPNGGPDVWLLVLDDMRARRGFGIAKYGMPVQPFNGRDVLRDAYEEALDLCVYLRQAIEERSEA